MPKLIDSHTHVQFAAFADDWKEAVDRALAEGTWFVNVGTQKDTSAKAVEIAEKYPEGVYAAVGIHPIHTEQSFHDEQEVSPSFAKATAGKGGFTSRGEEFDYDYYKKLGLHEKVVAIGECGFDFYAAFARSGNERLQKGAPRRSFSEGGAFQNTKEKQEKAFVAQIELSHTLEKPLMIHCRSAYPDLIRVLDSRFQLLASTPGIIHFFSGTKEDAQRLMDLGFYFSFGGVITFLPRRSDAKAGARDYDEVIKYIGLERIVLETDAPYVAPIPHRGKRNEPAYVSFVAEKLAEILGKSPDEIATQTTQNARSVLKI